MLLDLKDLEAVGDHVSLGVLLNTIGARGHGPIILTLAGLLMLPTGMIPMMPAAVGAVLALVAVEMIIGGKGVSLPRRLTRIQIGTHTLSAAVDRASPLAARLSRVIHPRWSILVHGTASLSAIAVALILASAVMIVFGAIPGLPFVLCIPALLFGLGLTAGDGVLVALGYVSCVVAVVLGRKILPKMLDLIPFL